MKLSKSELTGTGEVFSFTLRQYFKSRGNLLTNIVMLLLVLLSMPVLTYLTESGTVSVGGNVFEDSSNISQIYLYNATSLPLSGADELEDDLYWRNTSLTPTRDAAQEMGDSDVLLTVSNAGDSYAVYASATEGTDLSASDLEAALGVAQRLVTSALEAGMQDVTASQAAILASDYTVTVGDAHADAPQETGGASFGTRFAVQYGYAIIVLILCMTSSAFIIRAVLEEKSSKLVELLLISVKPLALLVGKILAVMTHTFIFLAAMVACFAASCGIASLLLGGGAVGAAMSGVTALLPAITLDVGHVLGLVVIVFVSLLLAYLMVALLGGVGGASCSSIEQMNAANGTVITLVMVGYLLSCIVCGVNIRAVTVASALVPVLSTFCAPVAYVMGDISFWVLLLSWLIQAGVIVLLALFAARVYAALIMHKGNPVKGKELRKLAGFGKKEAV